MSPFRITLTGRPGILKNSKRIVRRKKFVSVIPSDKYQRWEYAACHEITRQIARTPSFRKIDSPAMLTANFYFKNHQWEADLDNCVSGICDVLQKTGVIANDKLIVEMSLKKVFGEPVERVEIELRELKCETQVGTVSA